MWRLAAFLLILNWTCAQAQVPAAVGLAGAGGGGSAGASCSPTACPGDVVPSAIAWWGVRCYSHSYSGNVADIVDQATGDTTGTRLTCSNGTVSALVSSTACTFVTSHNCSALSSTCSSTCVVVTFYDQSGANLCASAACNLTQGSPTHRPVYTLNCINSTVGCITFGANTSVALSLGSSPTQAQPFTFSNVSEFTASSGNACVLISDSAGNYVGLYYNQGTQVQQIEANSSTKATFPSTRSAWHSQQVAFNGASSAAYQDGSNATITSPGNIGTSGMANSLNMGNDTFLDALTGNITEVGVWAFGFSSTQNKNMCANQSSYYGLSLTCN